MNWFDFSDLDWVSFGIAGTIQAGFYAALLAVVVLPINLLLRRWISASQMGLLWGLVLVRLMVPIAPSSPLSLQNFFTRTPSSTVSSAVSDTESLRLGYGDPNSSDTNTKSIQSVAENATQAAWEQWLTSIVMFAWPTVAIALLVWTFAANWRFSRKIKRSPQSTNPHLLDLWRTCSREASVRRSIPIILCEAVTQPAIMGVFRVRLLLPSDMNGLTDDQLRMVMLHELAHVRRWDVAINWGLAFIRSVQWWNPIYWLAAARFCSLREQACDAFVLRRLSGQTGRDYGNLLLTLAARTRSTPRWRVLLPTPMLGFILSSIRRRAISGRLRSIPRAAIRRGHWHTLTIAAVTLLLAVCGLTDALSSPSPTVEQWLDSSNDNAALHGSLPYTFVDSAAVESPTRSAGEPLVTREYDVGPALREIAGTHLSLDDARREFEGILRFDLQHPCTQKSKQTNEPLPAPGSANPSTDAESADNAGSIAWKITGDHLQLTAPASQHEHFAKCLLAWEQTGLAQICIECRFIGIGRIGPPFTSAANIPWRYIAPFSPDADDTTPLADQTLDKSSFQATARLEEFVPVVYAVLDSQQAKRLVADAQANIGAQIIQAPKITLFTGQQAFIADTTQSPFVVAVHEIGGDEKRANQPKIAIANEGTKITLRPTLHADRSSMQLNSRLEMSSIEDVGVAHVDSHHQGAAPCTIQVPKLRRLQIDIAAELKDGNSLLIGSPSERIDERRKPTDLFILLTPSVIPETLDPTE